MGFGLLSSGQPAQGPAPALGSPAQGAREARVALLLGTSYVLGACAYGLAVPSPVHQAACPPFQTRFVKPREVRPPVRGQTTGKWPDWALHSGLAEPAQSPS